MQWLLAALLGLLLLAAVPLAWFGWQYARADIPQPGEIEAAQVSQIFFNDGQTELARVVPPEGNRVQIPLEEVPEEVQNAVLAAEDRDFWTNSGFSFTGFARAAVGQLTGNSSAGGGSTITQQYVKNALVGNEHSYERKAKELVYSIKMTNSWSKEEILNAYLNTVYFGRNAYGIEAAAQAFFDKPARDLTPEEGGVLAASIQLPSQLDPWNNPEGSRARWDYVMDGLVEMGELTPQERDNLVYPETRDPEGYSAYTEATGPNGLIKNQVIEELQRIGITEDDLTNRGLEITTTVDATTQADVERISTQRLASLQDDARAAVVAIDPNTGAVRAYYGGDEASGWDYANAGLQTGSTFKIFALAAALQQGIPLTATFDASPVTLPGNIVVTNWDGSGGGMLTMTEATRTSSNTAFMRIQNELANTTQDTADMAHALGVARSIPGIPVTLRENGGQPYEGIVLGQYQSRVLDMATAMGTLTNRGVYKPTHFVQRVVDAAGNTLYEVDPGYEERRVSEQVADNVMQALQTVVPYSNATLAGGRPSAGKTGTAQLGDTGNNKDAWMVGATPQLAVAVWVGTADNTSAIFNEWGGNMFGSGTPAQIWKDVLDTTLEGQEFRSFPDATPVYWGVNPYSGGTGLGGGYYSGYGYGYGAGAGGATGGTGADTSAPAAPAEPEPAPVPEPVAPAPAPAPALPVAPPPPPQVQDAIDAFGNLFGG
ncbi:transglycosylase domain-containing protein [Corynebacterium sp.]|uniref:transglycosylase domain-containing protein n=1 Tax=Corynebacterium sp. TaxID=1720 RepID=UPI002A91610A|nr:transglycosylase domain-containing protein [Corynebacterium sp.]MDY5785466.1 transglycosylase domain-containing protein [Corynebacterium sp.]